MSLEVYSKKRDFKKTPEPISGKKVKRSTLKFVVQRHDASHLHYDFRLEMDGVLKSWAVPKGPSMIPGEKRLAMMVEDHPLDYGKFYGEIPKGNYGAGTVEILDRGTYKPMIEQGDPEKILLQQLIKGDLKIFLKGTYLNGRFALVRMKNTENQWLLIKKNDEFALSIFEIEQLKPLKSKKKQDNETSSENKREPFKKPQQVKTEPFPDPLPKPMMAKLTKEIMDNPDWFYEMKLDGYRMICSVNEGKVEMISRNGNRFNDKYGLLLREFKKIRDNVIIDGEMVIENSKGLTDFQLLQNYSTTQKGNLKFYAFDILYLNGHNITNLPLSKRKELLETFFEKYSFRYIFILPYQKGKGKKLFNDLAAKGYEGIIAKDPESVYLPGKRAETWLKIKAVQMQEAVICGFTLPRGSRKYFGSIILGLYEGGSLKYIGNAGTGFNETSLLELYTKFGILKTDKPPFRIPPKLTGAKGKPVWLKPELVANIKFHEWSDDEIMRSPVFMGLREDKNAGEVINESRESDQNGHLPEKIEENEKILLISGKKVKCTNLTKVYWPGEGYTKGDLINYYQMISKFILPYLKDRPQSLNRHPNGIKGQSFYQKDMDVEQIPSWVKTVKIYSKTNKTEIDYLICNDAATLIYMANLGCIEINPWHSSYKKPDHPAYLMLDLDPGDISFIDVVNTALVIKELCDEINIPCYCKTSGATGLHIYIPLGSKYDYEQAKTFAEILAGIAHHRLPSTTSIERSVEKRKDKVYIDFLQNRSAQTLAAPYSVRPRAFATVSTPLNWKEVNHQLFPEMFTIKNIESRLNAVGDIWQGVLKKGINISMALMTIEKLSG